MNRAVDIRPQAIADIDYYFLYIAEDSIGAAMRFHDAVRYTIEQIAEWPEAGSRRRFDEAEIAEVWSRMIEGFPKHLVFYMIPDQRTVRIIRVLHGALDLGRVLGAEEDS